MDLSFANHILDMARIHRKEGKVNTDGNGPVTQVVALVAKDEASPYVPGADAALGQGAPQGAAGWPGEGEEFQRT